MDQELKQYLDSVVGALEERLNASTGALEERLNASTGALEERLNAKTEALEERLNARIEKVETNLLTAFHGWARSMEIRVRGVSMITTGFDERLAHIEERVSELERKKAS